MSRVDVITGAIERYCADGTWTPERSRELASFIDGHLAPSARPVDFNYGRLGELSGPERLEALRLLVQVEETFGG